MSDARRRPPHRRGARPRRDDRQTSASRRTATVEITAIAAGGNGVGRHDGMVVFVPRTAPGDRVRVELQPKGRFSLGQMIELLEPSTMRVEPPCEHFVRDRCGGCQIQHLDPEAQLAAKRGILRDAVERIGKRGAEVSTVHASPRPWRYRNKLTLALRRRNAGWIAGLHPYDDVDGVFELHDCPITSEDVLQVWREVLDASEWLPDERALRGAVRADAGDASLVLEGGASWPTADRFFERVPSLGSLWWKPDGGARQLMARRRDGAASPAFAQVNPAMAAALRAHVLDVVARHAPSSVIDAYAGEGDLAVELERRGMLATAIELDPEAASRARARLSSTRVVEGRVEDTIAGVLPADLIVFNPPRSGLHASIPALLERRRASSPMAKHPAAIIYVSCNPATLARDIARLPSYRIASLEAFDMFPQTAHVEAVCELIAEASAA